MTDRESTEAVLTATRPLANLLNAASTKAQSYLRDVGTRPVGVTPEAIAAIERMLSGELPRSGQDPMGVLSLLDEFGSPATVASAGPRFFGGVIGGALPVSVAAQWLSAAWDQNACLFDFSPVGCLLEEVVLRWVLELLGLPADTGGAIVTGTQMADVTCLAAARLNVLSKTGWDLRLDGLAGSPPIRVIVGDEVHATMLKALALLGIGGKQIQNVPVDHQGRMLPSRIPKAAEPVIICCQVGNVNTGCCDPVSAVCDRAQDLGAWVHVDGAFGLWAAAAKSKRTLVAGADRADSWTTDAHKWLNVPYDCGIALVKNADRLCDAMAIIGSYYPDSDRRQPMFWGPESSRRARAVELWAALKFLGRSGVEALIERTCELAIQFAARLAAGGFEILNEVVLNQVLVSFGNANLTAAVIAEVQREGTCWCGGTVWRGRRAMRISVSSWATTRDDVDKSATAICAIARRLASKELE